MGIMLLTQRAWGRIYSTHPERLICINCGKKFMIGDYVYRKPTGGGRGMKYRCMECAIKLGMITKAELVARTWQDKVKLEKPLECPYCGALIYQKRVIA